MNQLIGMTLELGHYQCRRCGRMLYVNPAGRGSLDLDFGCPYGCDDNGRHVRDIRVEMKDMMDGPADVEERRVRA